MHTTATTTQPTPRPASQPASQAAPDTARARVRAVSWTLPAEKHAVPRARALTGRALAHWHITDPADADDIVLIVDELVTNAVVHGAGPVRLTLRLDAGGLSGEVHDTSPVVPVLPAAGPGPAADPAMEQDPERALERAPGRAENGRGLPLVTALATDCGARPGRTGKTLWFTRRLAP